MKKRKAVSASLRWQVFARDGFRCRYCGAQAGEPGVLLHADHVMSVADGGPSSYDNLVTACQKCNGGKAARSLDRVPASADVVGFLKAQASSLQEQADAIAAGLAARQEAAQAIVNLLCHAYGRKEIHIKKGDVTRLVNLSFEHGADVLADWITQTASRGVRTTQCVRYVHGIIRNIRAHQGGA